MTDFELKILTALKAAGGEFNCRTLKALYSDKGDGWRNHVMIRRGWTEWVRPNDDAARAAIAIRITNAGKAALKTAERGGA